MFTSNRNSLCLVKAPFMVLTAVMLACFFAFTGCSEGSSEAKLGKSNTYVIYFANSAALASHERCPYEGFVKLVSREISVNSISVEFLVKELIAGPDLSESEVEPILSDETRVLGLEIEDAVLYLDLSNEAYSETIQGKHAGKAFIDAFVLTTTQYPYIVKIQVSVEGMPWTDGSFAWEQPIGQYEILPSS